jgi:hypothetical protein
LEFGRGRRVWELGFVLGAGGVVLVIGFLRQGVGFYDLGLGGVGFLGWRAWGVGVVLRFIYLFLV